MTKRIFLLISALLFLAASAFGQSSAGNRLAGSGKFAGPEPWISIDSKGTLSATQSAAAFNAACAALGGNPGVLYFPPPLAFGLTSYGQEAQYAPCPNATVMAWLDEVTITRLYSSNQANNHLGAIQLGTNESILGISYNGNNLAGGTATNCTITSGSLNISCATPYFTSTAVNAGMVISATGGQTSSGGNTTFVSTIATVTDSEHAVLTGPCSGVSCPSATTSGTSVFTMGYAGNCIVVGPASGATISNFLIQNTTVTGCDGDAIGLVTADATALIQGGRVIGGQELQSGAEAQGVFHVEGNVQDVDFGGIPILDGSNLLSRGIAGGATIQIQGGELTNSPQNITLHDLPDVKTPPYGGWGEQIASANGYALTGIKESNIHTEITSSANSQGGLSFPGTLGFVGTNLSFTSNFASQGNSPTFVAIEGAAGSGAKLTNIDCDFESANGSQCLLVDGQSHMNVTNLGCRGYGENGGAGLASCVSLHPTTAQSTITAVSCVGALCTFTSSGTLNANIGPAVCVTLAGFTPSSYNSAAAGCEVVQNANYVRNIGGTSGTFSVYLPTASGTVTGFGTATLSVKNNNIDASCNMPYGGTITSPVYCGLVGGATNTITSNNTLHIRCVGSFGAPAGETCVAVAGLGTIDSNKVYMDASNISVGYNATAGTNTLLINPITQNGVATPFSGMTGTTIVPLETGLSAAGQIPNSTSGTASAYTATPTLGASGTLGSLSMGNATSGIVTLEPVTGALGAVTVLLPSAAGTAAVSATSPLSENATTGALACATCVTSAASLGTNQIVVGTSGGQGVNTQSSSATVSSTGQIAGSSLTSTGQTKSGAAGVTAGFVDIGAGLLTSAMSAQSSATCTTVTGMNWSIAASKNYILRCEVPITFAASATVAFCLNGPGTATSYSLNADGPIGASAAYDEINTLAQTAWQTKTSASGAPAATEWVHVQATIQNGSTASGTALALQTAANGTNNITVNANASCTLTQQD